MFPYSALLYDHVPMIVRASYEVDKQFSRARGTIEQYILERYVDYREACTIVKTKHLSLRVWLEEYDDA